MPMSLSSRLRRAPHRERGAVLFVALVFLILLTLIAVTASSMSILQEKMVGGMRNAHLAMSGAESALREGETRLWNASEAAVPFTVCGAQGLFDCYSFSAGNPIDTVANFRNSTSWVEAGAQQYSTKDLTNLGGDNENGNLDKNPRYIIEDLGIERPPGAGNFVQQGIDGDESTGSGNVTKHLYRITSRSTGGNEAVMRMAESTFASKSN